MQMWDDIGVAVGDVDAHLIRHLTPRVIDRLSNTHGAPEQGGEPGRLLSEELLVEVATALGTMESAGLIQLRAQLHRMTTKEVHDVINVRRSFRRTAYYCSFWARLLCVGGVFVGCPGTATIE